MTNPDITKMNFKTDCIVAKYIGRSVFKIPKDINHEDIDNYWIKWDVLHIEMKDGQVINIDPMWGGICEGDAFDAKYPDEVIIVEKDNEGCESDDEEDNNDEEEDDKD